MSNDHEYSSKVWTDSEFDNMSWHDVYVHGFAFDSASQELLLDLDYICQWIQSTVPNGTFSFLVVPATLAFQHARNIEFDDVEIGKFSPLGLEIEKIEKLDPVQLPSGSYADRDWCWNIECQQGCISVRATGFKQYARGLPRQQNSPRLSLVERGGIGFGKT